MRITNLLLIILCYAQISFGQLYLTNPIEVSTNGTGSRAPRIALLEDNRPIVYWGKTGNTPILYLSIWDDGNFGEPIEISTNGISPDLWGGGLGPQIAAQGQKIFLVFEDYGQGIYCIHSHDAGETFSDPVIVFKPSGGRTATLPSVAIDPNGNPVVSFITSNFSEEEALYEISRSEDSGLSFLTSTIANEAADGTEVCECCPSSIIALPDGEIYLAFRNNDNNVRDFWIAKSTDNAATFPESTDIDNVDWVIQSCPTSGPDMMISGDLLYTTFFNGGPLGVNIYFSILNKNTMEVVSQIQIPSLNGENQSQNFPSIAGNGDTLAVVWQEFGQAGLEIMMNWSTEGGENLLENSLTIDNSDKNQQLPDVAFENGRFHIVYEDLKLNRVVYRIASFTEIVSIENEFSTDHSVEVFPNPTTDLVNLIGLIPCTIELYNTNGQLMDSRKTILEKEQFDIQKYDAGIYYFHILEAGNELKKHAVKFVKN